jgi:hypothetical protein
MERLWSPAGATSGNRWQMGRARKPLKLADPQPVATHRNRFNAHGKEGVDGSSPSEGSAKAPHVGAFVLSRSGRLARRRSCGWYGAVHGAFALTTSPERQPGGDFTPNDERRLKMSPTARRRINRRTRPGSSPRRLSESRRRSPPEVPSSVQPHRGLCAPR